MQKFAIGAAAAALALAGASLAQAGESSAMHMSGMDTPQAKAAMPAASQELGAHAMPGTVTRVDHATGMVYVTSLGMHMAVHFPPPTIKELKAGDKILVHLGYSMLR